MWDHPPRQVAAAFFSRLSQDYDLTLQTPSKPHAACLHPATAAATPRGDSGDRMAKAPAPARQQITVIGAPRAALRDFYHLFLRARWSVALAGIVASYVALNAIFATAYLCTGGIANARPGSFFVAFCETAVIGPMDGVPTLMMRVGNERGNLILEATIRVSLIRSEKTREGIHFYRMYDLALTRERSPAMNRSWTVLHPVVAGSPLLDASPESVARDEVELLVTVVGVDDTSMQPVHARHRYYDSEILWGARHADILNEQPDGTLIVDMRRFHQVVPTDPIAGFPYPKTHVAGA